MNPSFQQRYSEEIELFKSIYAERRDVKAARAALEQRNVHPRIINKIADIVLSSLGTSVRTFSGDRGGFTGAMREEDDDVADIQKRAGISTLTRRDAHKRTMKQLDAITKPLGKLASLAYDAGIPLETIVEELRETMLEMYAKKDERRSRRGRQEREERSSAEAELAKRHPG